MSRNHHIHGSGRWQALRASWLRRHPWCVVCAQLGQRTRGVEVDHVEAERLGGDPWNPGNLQTLCKTHHSQKTARSPESGAFKSHRPFTVIGADGYSIPAGIQPAQAESEE